MPCCPDRHVYPRAASPSRRAIRALAETRVTRAQIGLRCSAPPGPELPCPLGAATPAAIVPHLPDAGLEQAKSLTHRELNTVLHGNGGKAGEPPRIRSQAFSKPACRTEMGSAQATHTERSRETYVAPGGTRTHPRPASVPSQKGIFYLKPNPKTSNPKNGSFLRSWNPVLCLS